MKNPFLQSVRLKVFILESKFHVIDTKDVNTVKSTLNTQQEFEKDPFIKLYSERNFMNVFKNTSDTASKLFLYIAYTLEKNSDVIYINAEKAMEFVGIKSPTTYYKYVQELIDNAIITRKSNSEYWINPLFLFNGNRIEFYKAHCPECLDILNITEVQQNRVLKKKKHLMEYYGCKSYYALKKLLGEEQIQLLLSGKQKLERL